MSVHILTAAGGGLAFLALLAAVREHWATMFAWLGAALVVDGIDGPLARRLNVRDVQPDWSGDVPASGENSQMYIEMTLVENATGAVLWHAHQKFPASAANKNDMNRVVRTMLASLPAR